MTWKGGYASCSTKMLRDTRDEINAKIAMVVQSSRPGESRIENTPPGTVVDDVITLPKRNIKFPKSSVAALLDSKQLDF